MNKIQRVIAQMLAAVLAAGAMSAAATEIRPVSTASCQTYYKGAVFELGKLQFRPDGITNVSQTPQYVICPLPKSGVLWNVNYFRQIVVYFRTGEIAPVAPFWTNACTLNVGTPVNGGMRTKTLAAKKMAEKYGDITFDESTGPEGLSSDAATLVCVIAPRYVLEHIYFEEG